MVDVGGEDGPVAAGDDEGADAVAFGGFVAERSGDGDGGGGGSGPAADDGVLAWMFAQRRRGQQ